VLAVHMGCQLKVMKPGDAARDKPGPSCWPVLLIRWLVTTPGRSVTGFRIGGCQPGNLRSR